MLTMALVGKFVTDWAGGASAITEFSARFVKPVIVPAGKQVDLTVSAKVVEVLNGFVRLDLTATSGDVRVLGMAKALVLHS
jgi:acyl dehydratase